MRGGVLAALISVLVPDAASAQADESRDPRIDGSSMRSFEESVAKIQNDLRPRRREDFERALVVIWMGHTVGSSDRDGNGDLDIDESRLLEDDARDLLKQIQRGNVLSAIEEREKHAAGYTAAEFIAELDGLDHDEVFELAGRPSEELYLEHRQQARNWDPSVDLCEIILPGAAGGAVAGAVPIAFVVPRYPKSAWERGQSGAVCIEFGLDSAGAPKDLVVFGFTANMFVQPALAALSQWKYPPPSAIELDEHNRFRAQIVFVCCRGTGILIKVGR